MSGFRPCFGGKTFFFGWGESNKKGEGIFIGINCEFCGVQAITHQGTFRGAFKYFPDVLDISSIKSSTFPYGQMHSMTIYLYRH